MRLIGTLVLVYSAVAKNYDDRVQQENDLFASAIHHGEEYRQAQNEAVLWAMELEKQNTEALVGIVQAGQDMEVALMQATWSNQAINKELEAELDANSTINALELQIIELQNVLDLTALEAQTRQQLEKQRAYLEVQLMNEKFSISMALLEQEMAAYEKRYNQLTKAEKERYNDLMAYQQGLQDVEMEYTKALDAQLQQYESRVSKAYLSMMNAERNEAAAYRSGLDAQSNALMMQMIDNTAKVAGAMVSPGQINAVAYQPDIAAQVVTTTEYKGPDLFVETVEGLFQPLETNELPLNYYEQDTNGKYIPVRWTCTVLVENANGDLETEVEFQNNLWLYDNNDGYVPVNYDRDSDVFTAVFGDNDWRTLVDRPTRDRSTYRMPPELYQVWDMDVVPLDPYSVYWRYWFEPIVSGRVGELNQDVVGSLPQKWLKLNSTGEFFEVDVIDPIYYTKEETPEGEIFMPFYGPFIYETVSRETQDIESELEIIQREAQVGAQQQMLEMQKAAIVYSSKNAFAYPTPAPVNYGIYATAAPPPPPPPVGKPAVVQIGNQYGDVEDSSSKNVAVGGSVMSGATDPFDSPVSMARGAIQNSARRAMSSLITKMLSITILAMT